MSSLISKIFKALFKASPTLGKAAADAQAEIVAEFLATKTSKMEQVAAKAGKLFHLSSKKKATPKPN